MKRFAACLLCMLLLCTTAHCESGRPIPQCLRFSLRFAPQESMGTNTHLRRCYPQTALPQVNGEIAVLVDTLANTAQRPGVCKKEGYLDVTCRVSRSGNSAMSFLVLAATVEDYRQTHVSFQNRVYDMQSGEQILLPRLFNENDDIWLFLSGEVRRQIEAYYPQLTADADVLDELCQPENIRSAAFSLTPVQLELHYTAETVYGKPTVMHVRIPYSALQPYLSSYGRQQTDNSGYKLIALTYDDGPTRNTSRYLMDTLLAHGANATFFVVGTRLNSHQDILCREQDTGFQVASHNYEHVYKETDLDKIRNWKTKFDTELSCITGTLPTVMRAPGGNFGKFVRAQVGLPLIQWSIVSDDASSDHSEQRLQRIIGIVRNRAVPGAIVLMHDMNFQCPLYTEEILIYLEQQNFFCVTVDELFLHYGIELQPDQVYYDAVTPAETVK